MRKTTYAIIAVFILAIAPAIAQVGIGTTGPKSVLDIQASNELLPAYNDGILIPRVSAFPLVNPGADQDGMMIFLTNPIGTDDKGFYYWDDTPKRWRSIGAEEWKDGSNESGDQYIYATQAKLLGTDMVITDDGRIGFGTDDPVERFEFRGPGDNDFQITSANTNPPNFILYNTGGTIDVPTALATDQEIGALVIKTHDGTGVKENGGFRFYMDGTPAPGSVPSKFVISTTPNGTTSQRERIIVRSTGNVGISESNPTATLHLRAGTATAGSAPLKFTAGTNLGTPEAGTVEYDGTNLYFTPNTTRKILLKGLTNTATLDFPNIPINSSSELTVTVNGATVGSSCSCAPNAAIEAGLTWSCYVSAVNTVRIRLSNIQNTAINPVGKNWKVTVIE
ncbi:hypothetical protein [Constantimarinum furrinae]|uniref:Uncharacterized protein n=1 Tax=Constantimarinum furrinae TaxID=2562285 RepID=A0A7G8PXH3_9FLAO|nr:hypothetical protein [Constantimarinum furrinae]QNJ99039.1 hypothetical protein ALE3EI_2503 [Constantimarinum furrinae]